MFAVQSIAAGVDTTVLLAIVAAVASLVGTLVLGIITWKTRGRERAWTKEDAEAVATTLAAKVREDRAELRAEASAIAEKVAAKAKEESNAVSMKLIERAEALATTFSANSEKILAGVRESREEASAAFKVGNHGNEKLTNLTALIANMQEQVMVLQRRVGEEAVPTLESVSQQVGALSKEMHSLYDIAKQNRTEEESGHKGKR
jgi:type IV secretory pathway VirJ component